MGSDSQRAEDAVEIVLRCLFQKDTGLLLQIVKIKAVLFCIRGLGGADGEEGILFQRDSFHRIGGIEAGQAKINGAGFQPGINVLKAALPDIDGHIRVIVVEPAQCGRKPVHGNA